jgi:hypothetical protein
MSSGGVDGAKAMRVVIEQYKHSSGIEDDIMLAVIVQT